MNDIRNAFEAVKAPEDLKAFTAAALLTCRKCHTRQAFAVLRPLAAVCAGLLLLVAGVFWALRTPVSYISVDVNPSVELALNLLDRVITATPCNEDGEAVLKELHDQGLRLEGRPYAGALDLLLESAPMAPYLTEEAALAITVAARNTEKEELLLSGVESTSGCRGNGGRCSRTDLSALAEAHAQGLSFGKYSAFLELSRYDSSVTAEDCRHMTMAELHARIAACEEDHGPDHDEEPEHGSAHEQTVSSAESSASDPESCTQSSGQNSGSHGEDHGSGYGAGNGQGAGAGNGQGSGNGSHGSHHGNH